MKARKKLTIGMLVGALVIGLNLLGAGIAQAATVFTVEHFGSVRGLCLEPEGGFTLEIVPIELQPCDGSPEQRWLFQPFGGTNRFQIANESTHLCMNAFDGAHDNARVLQVQCVPISNEQWRTDRALPDVTRLMSRERFSDTNICIDVPFNLPGVGVDVQLFTCNSTDAQRWAVRTA
jgi:hypothetical protein